MKKLLTLTLTFITLSLSAQVRPYLLVADTVRMQAGPGITTGVNLQIKNATKDTIGFLYNKGEGVTIFKRGAIKLNDSTYLIGADTLRIKATGASNADLHATLAIGNTTDGLNISGGTGPIGLYRLDVTHPIGITVQNNMAFDNGVDGEFNFRNWNGTNYDTLFSIYENGTLFVHNKYLLPNVDGTSDQVLKTDGAGNVSWSSIAAQLNLIQDSGIIIYGAIPDIHVKADPLYIATIAKLYDVADSVGAASKSIHGAAVIGDSTTIPLKFGAFTNPHPSAQLDIESTTKGLLIPRMNTSDQNAIDHPANALLIWNLDSSRLRYYLTSDSSWHSIGTNCGGGEGGSTLQNAFDAAPSASPQIGAGGNDFSINNAGELELQANEYAELKGGVDSNASYMNLKPDSIHAWSSYNDGSSTLLMTDRNIQLASARYGTPSYDTACLVSIGQNNFSVYTSPGHFSSFSMDNENIIIQANNAGVGGASAVALTPDYFLMANGSWAISTPSPNVLEIGFPTNNILGNVNVTGADASAITHVIKGASSQAVDYSLVISNAGDTISHITEVGMDKYGVTFDYANIDSLTKITKGYADATYAPIGGGGGDSLPYKVYTAILTQTGTAAPAVTIMQNTIGDIVWTRTDVGKYLATLEGAFTSDKTVMMVTPGFTSLGGDDIVVPIVDYINGDSIGLYDKQWSGGSAAPADGVFLQITVEIRVYE